MATLDLNIVLFKKKSNCYSGVMSCYRCSCGNCRIMPTEYESICCQEICAVANKTGNAQIKCITEHDGFAPNFLNHHVVELAVFEFNGTDGPLDDNDEIHK